MWCLVISRHLFLPVSCAVTWWLQFQPSEALSGCHSRQWAQGGSHCLCLCSENPSGTRILRRNWGWATRQRARFVEHSGISAVTLLGLTSIKRGCSGWSVKVLLWDSHSFWAKWWGKFAKFPDVQRLAAQFSWGCRMHLVMKKRLNLFLPADFHLIPALPLFRVQNCCKEIHSACANKLSKE